MVNDIKTEIKFLKDIGVSKQAVELLTSNTDSIKTVRIELEKLKDLYQDMPKNIDHLPEEFNTYLWTLLGEISIPNSLGEGIPEYWPILFFPFAKEEEEDIAIDYLESHGFIVEKREKIIFNQLLHACLYGGQDWFDSLRYALNEKVNVWRKEAVLLWMKKDEKARCSIATMARKMQLQLRPTMTAYKVTNEELIYPGILRAFHTPNLGNIEMHNLILNLEEWKC